MVQETLRKWAFYVKCIHYSSHILRRLRYLKKSSNLIGHYLVTSKDFFKFLRPSRNIWTLSYYPFTPFILKAKRNEHIRPNWLLCNQNMCKARTLWEAHKNLNIFLVNIQCTKKIFFQILCVFPKVRTLLLYVVDLRRARSLRSGRI